MRHSTQKTQGLVGFAKGAPFGGGLVVGGFGRDAAMTVSNFANVLPDAAPVTVGAGGTVTLTCSDVIGALTINGGTVNLGVNGGTVQMTAATQALSLAGNVTATSDATGSATISGGACEPRKHGAHFHRERRPAGAGPHTLAIADFNGDGNLDAAVTHSSLSSFVAVLLGKGDATFTPQLRNAYPRAAKPPPLSRATLTATASPTSQSRMAQVAA